LKTNKPGQYPVFQNGSNGESKENKLFELKPVFNVYLNYLRFIPYTAFLVALLALYIKILGKIKTLDFSDISTMVSFYPMFIAFIAILFILPLVYLLKLKDSYEKTVYIFYEETIFYLEGYWRLYLKNIEVNNIKSIKIDKGFIQQFFGLGYIKIKTEEREIIFNDIPFIEQVKKRLKNFYDIEIS
jgi:uncharacterized membrane protein YdbT with pleckstrin-like domain